LPLQAAESIERIDVMMGNRLFSADPRRERAWTVHEENTIRVLEAGASLTLARSRVKRFHAVMNWAGDSRYAARLAIAIAWTLGALAALSFRVNLLTHLHRHQPLHVSDVGKRSSQISVVRIRLLEMIDGAGKEFQGFLIMSLAAHHAAMRGINIAERDVIVAVA